MGKNSKRIFMTALVVVTMMVSALNVSAFSFGKYEKVKANGEVVSIPVAKAAGGKAKFYRFDDSGREISFFLVKAGDGSYRTAFDACDACYKEKKGYEQQDDKMVCKNCNMKFGTNRIGPHAIGGCNPSYLPSRVSGGNVIINVSDLKSGARFF